MVSAGVSSLKDDIAVGIHDIENDNFSEKSVDEIIKKAKSQNKQASRK